MKVIITMAGEGKRFKQQGYSEEKYEIMFHGHTLFEWSMISLKNFFYYDFIFITRDLPKVEDFIINMVQKLGIKSHSIIILPQLTRGQAETALMAEPHLSSNDSILIYNIDTFVHPNELKTQDIKGDGWIPAFKEKGTRWSFLKVDEENRVIETTEKKRISEWCSVGAYYFKYFKVFKEYTFETLDSKLKETYIAPIYNKLIKNGMKIFMKKIHNHNVLILGTPDDLKIASKKIHNIDLSNLFHY